MADLSKSRFLAGLQCLRYLWWRVREPDAPELVVDSNQQAIFDRGTRVGEVARDYVPDGTLIEAPHYQVSRRLALTWAAIRNGARVISEASFKADRVFAAVDILSRRSDGWVLTEVKSTLDVKPEHLPDVAIQLHVLERAGVDVRRAEVMHLNRDCRYPNLDNLFLRCDVTEQARAILREVPHRIRAEIAALDGPLPEVEVGDHCSTPYECTSRARCWPKEAEDHIGTLYSLAATTRRQLLAEGVRTISDIPEGFPLSAVQRRQHEAKHPSP